jgi:hypothetical protein
MHHRAFEAMMSDPGRQSVHIDHIGYIGCFHEILAEIYFGHLEELVATEDLEQR